MQGLRRTLPLLKGNASQKAVPCRLSRKDRQLMVPHKTLFMRTSSARPKRIPTIIYFVLLPRRHNAATTARSSKLTELHSLNELKPCQT